MIILSTRRLATNKSIQNGLKKDVDNVKALIKTLAILIIVGLLPVTSTNAATYLFHNDHLGTPQALTNANQQVVWQSEQQPFGDVTTSVNQAEQNLRFPGQYFDKETGLHYNYHRTYEAIIGRYTESDPIGLMGGISTFGYAHMNPINLFDHFGLAVFIKCRPANIAKGLVKHCWVVTDSKSAGMGTEPGIQPGQQYDGYGVKVQITDHSNDSATESTEIFNVDEQCVNEKLEIGKPLGRFLPPLNHCQSFAYGVINQCRVGPQIGPFR